jgi:serine/threonine-protein kinase
VTPAAPLPQPGEFVAAWRIERLLARGVASALYLATAPQTRQRVALKLLTALDAGARTRFAAEARALRRLRHPAIVEVHAAGIADDRAYVAMALLPGADLRRHTRPARLLPEPLVLRLGADLADALAHAHALGIVHRDVKPANLVFDAATRRVWLTDFGVARLPDGARTDTGVLLGTPAFMAPEQLAGGAPTPAGDVYALAAALFQLLSGALACDAPTLGALLHAQAAGAARALAGLRPDLPAALSDLLAQALQPAPAQRPTAAALACRLAALAQTLR